MVVRGVTTTLFQFQKIDLKLTLVAMTAAVLAACSRGRRRRRPDDRPRRVPRAADALGVLGRAARAADAAELTRARRRRPRRRPRARLRRVRGVVPAAGRRLRPAARAHRQPRAHGQGGAPRAGVGRRLTGGLDSRVHRAPLPELVEPVAQAARSVSRLAVVMLRRRPPTGAAPRRRRRAEARVARGRGLRGARPSHGAAPRAARRVRAQWPGWPPPARSACARARAVPMSSQVVFRDAARRERARPRARARVHARAPHSVADGVLGVTGQRHVTVRLAARLGLGVAKAARRRSRRT